MKRLLACAAFALSATAFGQVALQGMLGGKALLIIDGAAPRLLAPGQSHEGVKVLSTTADQAVVEIDGRRHTLRIGEGPASVGAGRPSGGSSGKQIVLTAGSGGHFVTPGAINGRSVNFLVDTGATFVSMSTFEADRLRIDYKGKGMPGVMSTANGEVNVWRMQLDSVRVGDVELFNVDAVLSPASMPYILLGNSFLSRFQMTQGNGQMVLERRY